MPQIARVAALFESETRANLASKWLPNWHPCQGPDRGGLVWNRAPHSRTVCENIAGLVRHTMDLSRANKETLFASAAFIGESTEVRGELID